MEFHEHEHELGFIEVKPKPSTIELGEFYRDHYYQNAEGGKQASYSQEEKTLFDNLAKVSIRVAQRLNCVEKSLLDIGCGEGFFSAFFDKNDWKVKSTDFSDFGIRKFNPELLKNFIQGDGLDVMRSALESGERFGLINFSNVLEHVREPLEFLTSIPKLTDRDTLIRCELPNDYSDFQEMLRKNDLTKNTWFSPPQHLSYFNTVNIREVFAHCGLEILTMIASFPIEIFIANPNSNYARDRSLGKGAHCASMMCTNHLISKNIDAYIDYCTSGAELGFGRCFTVYARPIS